MSYWTDLRLPAEYQLLVGFYDLTGFQCYVDTVDAAELLDTMAGYFMLTGKIIDAAGGRLIKTIGDAGLAAFPAEQAAAGVRAFQEVRREGARFLAARGCASQAIVKLHLGPVAVGRVGGPGNETIEVYGRTVNTAARLDSTGLAMTPAVFRALPAEARRDFRKHTPPILYIEAGDRRPA